MLFHSCSSIWMLITLLISPPVYLLYADGPEPRRSSRSRDCPRIQDGPC
jgi:hypothetical protein